MDWDSVDENDGGPTYMSLSASSYHPGGVNALFADGSVRFVKNSVSPVTWAALGTIAGGEVVAPMRIDTVRVTIRHRWEQGREESYSPAPFVLHRNVWGTSYVE